MCVGGGGGAPQGAICLYFLYYNFSCLGLINNKILCLTPMKSDIVSIFLLQCYYNFIVIE